MKIGIVVKDEVTNKTWLCCPTCGKKQFPLDGSEVDNLRIACKMCKTIFLVTYSSPAIG